MVRVDVTEAITSQYMNSVFILFYWKIFVLFISQLPISTYQIIELSNRDPKAKSGSVEIKI